MAHHEDHMENLSHDELKYREHMKRAADLCKIDLFLTARSEFQLALRYKPDDAEAESGVTQCTANIARDRKKVLVLAPIVIAIIIAVIIFA
jgi:hypothetical protein